MLSDLRRKTRVTLLVLFTEHELKNQQTRLKYIVFPFSGFGHKKLLSNY